MDFDISNVYTRENADELSNEHGAIVCIADTMPELKELVENDETTILDCIGRKDSPMPRFWTPARPYRFAYLVCPARNADAYLKWEGQDKPIEMQVAPNGEWTDVTDEMIESEKDFWFHYAVRVKAREFRPVLKQAPASPQYRPYKDVEELITDYEQRHCYKDNDDIMPLIWVKKGAAKKKKLITAFFEGENLVSVDGEIYDLEYLYKDYTFLDGTPCGVEEV